MKRKKKKMIIYLIVPTNELHLLCKVKLFYTYFTECNTKGRENFKPYSTAAVVSVTKQPCFYWIKWNRSV